MLFGFDSFPLSQELTREGRVRDTETTELGLGLSSGFCSSGPASGMLLPSAVIHFKILRDLTLTT